MPSSCQASGQRVLSAFAVASAAQVSLLCVLLLSPGCETTRLSRCIEAGYVDVSPNSTAALASVKGTIGKDVTKTCLKMLEQKAHEANHFYVLGINESIILESDMCGEDESQVKTFVDQTTWSVATRKANKHMPLFGFPVNHADPNWLQKRPMAHSALVWSDLHSLPNKDDFCITRSGQLHVLRFDPEMAGTYRATFKPGGVFVGSRTLLENELKNNLKTILHHLDYVYDQDDTFDGLHVRQTPVLAPKVTKARMFAAERDLRYQYRTASAVLRSADMSPAISDDPKAGPNIYPEKLFRQFALQMKWVSPPDLHQFTRWKPNCGTRIIRDRYMQCSVEVDVAKLERSLNRTAANSSIISEKEYSKQITGGFYKDTHALNIMYLLYALVKRLQVQLIDESIKTPNRRPLYMVGLRWTETGHTKLGAVVPLKLTVPCHYTFLHHLPRSTVIDERRANVFIPAIGNAGEREQGVRLCGLADPLELLRMIGQVLVAHLRRLVNMTRRRPVVPQRSIVFSGKTVYMKCPVDPHMHERPVCNVPGKEDTIVWTLNDKSMRFFSEEVERGPALSADCGLSITNIGFNDAGWYVCYRTAIGGKSVEDEPAYRHYVDIVKPDFDPPPVEEVYFGLAVCFAWIGILLVLWSAIAVIRGLLHLLYKDPDSKGQQEVWTSFYDNDPVLEEARDKEVETEEDDDDDDDDEEEDEEEGEDGGGKDEQKAEALLFGLDVDGVEEADAKSQLAAKDASEAKVEGEGKAEGEAKAEAHTDAQETPEAQAKHEEKPEEMPEAQENTEANTKPEEMQETQEKTETPDSMGEAIDENGTKVEGKGQAAESSDKGGLSGQKAANEKADEAKGAKETLE